VEDLLSLCRIYPCFGTTQLSSYSSIRCNGNKIVHLLELPICLSEGELKDMTINPTKLSLQEIKEDIKKIGFY